MKAGIGRQSRKMLNLEMNLRLSLRLKMKMKPPLNETSARREEN
jgi:hypothetical protein